MCVCVCVCLCFDSVRVCHFASPLPCEAAESGGGQLFHISTSDPLEFLAPLGSRAEMGMALHKSKTWLAHSQTMALQAAATVSKALQERPSLARAGSAEALASAAKAAQSFFPAEEIELLGGKHLGRGAGGVVRLLIM